MSISGARIWVIRSTLIITGMCFVFFLLAPSIGYPLTFSQSTRLLEIVLPVFLAYLGSATYFLFGTVKNAKELSINGSKELLSLMIKGPIYVFGSAMLAAMIAFWYSNRSSAIAGDGMSLDTLAGAISGALGLLAVTTNVAVSFLFSSESKAK